VHTSRLSNGCNAPETKASFIQEFDFISLTEFPPFGDSAIGFVADLHLLSALQTEDRSAINRTRVKKEKFVA
jgi:hypothetical protein